MENHSNLTDGLDIIALAHCYLDGELSPTQLAELNARLRNDEQSRTEFIRCVLQCAHLDEAMLPAESDQSGSNDSASDAGAPEPAKFPSPSVSSPVLGGLFPSAIPPTGMGFTQSVATLVKQGVQYTCRPLPLGVFALSLVLAATLFVPRLPIQSSQELQSPPIAERTAASSSSCTTVDGGPADAKLGCHLERSLGLRREKVNRCRRGESWIW